MASDHIACVHVNDRREWKESGLREEEEEEERGVGETDRKWGHSPTQRRALFFGDCGDLVWLRAFPSVPPVEFNVSDQRWPPSPAGHYL